MADEYDISKSPLGQRMAGGAKASTDFGAAGGGGGIWDALSEIPGAIAADIGYSLQSIPHLPAALTPGNGTIGFLDKSVGDEELRHRKRAVADAALLLAGAGFGKLAAAVQRGASPTILKVLLGQSAGGAAVAGATENVIFSQLAKMPGDESNIGGDAAVGALFGAGVYKGLGWLGKKFAKPTEEAAKKVGTAEAARAQLRIAEEAFARQSSLRIELAGVPGINPEMHHGPAPGVAAQRIFNDLELEQQVLNPPAENPLDPALVRARRDQASARVSQAAGGADAAKAKMAGLFSIEDEVMGAAVNENDLRNTAADAILGDTFLDADPDIQYMVRMLQAERMVALGEGRTDWVDDAVRRAARNVEGEPKRLVELLEGDFVLPKRDATRRFLHAEAGQHKWANRNERLQFASEVLKRPVTTFSDINDLEALNVVNALRARRGMKAIVPPRIEANAGLLKVRGGHARVRFTDSDQKMLYDLPDRMQKGFVDEAEMARLGEIIGVPPAGVPAAAQMYRDFVHAAVKVNGPGRMDIPSFADFMDKMPDMVVRSRNEVLASLTNRSDPNASGTVGRAGRRASNRVAQTESAGTQRGRKSSKKESALANEQIKKGGKPKVDGPDETLPPPPDAPGGEPSFTPAGGGRPRPSRPGGPKMIPVGTTANVMSPGVRAKLLVEAKTLVGKELQADAEFQKLAKPQQALKAQQRIAAKHKELITSYTGPLGGGDEFIVPRAPSGGKSGVGGRGTGTPRATKALEVPRSKAKGDWSPIIGAPRRAGQSKLVGANFGPITVTARRPEKTHMVVFENLSVGRSQISPEFRKQLWGRAKRLANQESRESAAFQKMAPAEQAALLKKTAKEKWAMLMQAANRAEAKRAGTAMLADLYNNHTTRVVQVTSGDGKKLMKLLEADGLVSETTQNRWALKEKAGDGIELRRKPAPKKGKVTAGKIAGMKPKERAKMQFTTEELEKAGTGALVKSGKHPRYVDLEIDDPEALLRDLEYEYSRGRLSGSDYRARKRQLLAQKDKYENPEVGFEGTENLPVLGAPPPEPVRPETGSPARKVAPGRSAPKTVKTTVEENPNARGSAPEAKPTMVDPMEGGDPFEGMDVLPEMPTAPPSPPIAGSTNLDKPVPVRTIAFGEVGGGVVELPKAGSHGHGLLDLEAQGRTLEEFESKGFVEGGKYTPTDKFDHPGDGKQITPEGVQRFVEVRKIWRKAGEEGTGPDLLRDHDFRNKVGVVYLEYKRVNKHDPSFKVPPWLQNLVDRMQGGGQ